jgi:hypothetical protein
MAWNMTRIRSSMMALLSEPDAGADHESQLEHIRSEMYDCMALVLPSEIERPVILRRLQAAQDIQALWYLRSELMHALSTYCGETKARTLLDQLTALFRGHLPAAQFASAQRKRAASF